VRGQRHLARLPQQDALGAEGLVIAPIIRVDIFQNAAGDFVVNEFEGLEADIHPKINWTRYHVRTNQSIFNYFCL
jgi:hypothetical protein